MRKVKKSPLIKRLKFVRRQLKAQRNALQWREYHAQEECGWTLDESHLRYFSAEHKRLQIAIDIMNDFIFLFYT